MSSGVLRIVTHLRMFKEPATALDFINELQSSPATVPIVPGGRHWQLFTELGQRIDANGNQIPIAHLAAMAIELGASWGSADRSFAGYPQLTWMHPVDD